MRNYSQIHIIQQDLKQARHELVLLQCETQPQTEKIAKLKKYIKETGDYYERNKEKLKQYEKRKAVKLERCNSLIKQRCSALKVLIRKYDYLKSKPESSYRTKELPKVRDKTIKWKEDLRLLRQWRRNYLSNLKPASELYSYFEAEVMREEFERRRKE